MLAGCSEITLIVKDHIIAHGFHLMTASWLRLLLIVSIVLGASACTAAPPAPAAPAALTATLPPVQAAVSLPLRR
jgi:hypothetical protein